jgi:hypothetical protein
MSAHALFSPSGAKKWMACSGSVAMEHGQPDDVNEYTDEGTAAHALAAMCLTEEKSPDAFVGRKLVVVNGVYWPGGDAPLPPLARGHKTEIRREFTVSFDMAADVKTYVQNIRKYAALAEAELYVEERVPIEHITFEENAAGTADVVIYVPGEDSELQVHDLKFGRGVMIFAKENPQGMMYLLGALEKLMPLFGIPKRYRFVVHQPRLNHLDEWDCTHRELMVFAKQAQIAAQDSLYALNTRDKWIGKENKFLTAGRHCSDCFCKARATCPALAAFTAKVIGADFEVLGNIAKADDAGPGVEELIPTDLRALGEKGAVLDIIQDWCKQVRAKIEAALFEQNNSEVARNALGFKLVQGKKGARKWSDEDAAIEALKKMRLKVEDIYDMSVKTPPALEKVLKDQPKRWAKLTGLIKQEPGQPSVAPLDDSRPAMEIKPAIEEFEAADGSDLV